MRHIYVGLSTRRVWCGAKSWGSQAPVTEGEYIDGFGDDTCPDCIKAIEPVRGKPNAE